MFSPEKIDFLYQKKLARLETRGGGDKVKRKCRLCDKKKLTPDKIGTYIWAFDSLKMTNPLWCHLSCWEKLGY